MTSMNIEDYMEVVCHKMKCQAEYANYFQATHNFLLKEDGPLPYVYRHYIAIIASARHYCADLVKLHEQEFLTCNGDPEWLKGIQFAPQKIQEFYEVNKILAHQPWLITKSHISKLLKSSEPWSLSELMHAIILLAHFHSLCSFIHSCGTISESGSSIVRTDDSRNDSSLSNISGLKYVQTSSDMMEELVQRMKRLSEASQEDQMEMMARFCVLDYIHLNDGTFSTSTKPEVGRYIISRDFSYRDFASRNNNNEVPTFRASDYSWEDHGFSLVSQLYSEVGSLLEDKFNIVSCMTCEIMEDSHYIDTPAFRQAIWNYIHSIYGIRHDDYDYSEVNHLLERHLKTYIKTVACFPEKLDESNNVACLKTFSFEEKVHINLLVMEARQQAELLYALRALNRYMT